MTISAKDGGLFKTATSAYARDAAVWKQVIEGYVKDSGLWKLFHLLETIQLSNRTVSRVTISPTVATVSYRISADGNVNAGVSFTDVGDWITPQNNMANYEVRATQTGGVEPITGSALNTWLACTVNRTWTLVNNTAGTIQESTMLVEIRNAATAIVGASATITFHCDMSFP